MNRTLPPSNIDAEMSILGAVFLDSDAIKKVSTLIDAGDFYRENHRKILHAMLQLQLRGEPIDLITMTATMKASGDLEPVGGAAYLAVLIDFVPTSANVQHYCKIVKEASVRRQIIAYGRQMMELGHGNDPLDEGIKDAKGELSSLMAGMDSFGGVNIRDITTVDDRAESYITQVRTFSKSRFVTGFEELDWRIRGVAPGEVMTIIAEPGGFKTAWLQNLLMGGAKRTGYYHLFFSIEMPAEKVFEREVQIANGIGGRDVEGAYKEMAGRAQDLHKGLYASGSQGLLVCSNPRISVEKIGRYVDLAQTKWGKLGAIGIDYLGLMQAPGKTIYEKTSFVAPELKHLAKELHLPIILLCQINREGAKQTHDILITDAKGGGDIEASADIMLGFYHDQGGTLVCKGLKNRNGANGWRLAVNINKEAFQFLGMSEYEEGDAPPPTAKTRGAVERIKRGAREAEEMPPL